MIKFKKSFSAQSLFKLGILITMCLPPLNSTKPNFPIQEIVDVRALQLLERAGADHLEESGIGVDDLPVECRDVDSLL